MLIRIDPAEPRPIYVQIMDEVRRAVVMGIVSPDEALPSVRGLASDLRVNPNTVQQAYRELEQEGVVHVRRGQGTFVTARAFDGTERAALVRNVARRALRDAHRHGLTVAELVGAIRAAESVDGRPKPEEEASR